MMDAGPGHSPTVSFILPTLNAGALLDNCLESIARQTFPRDRYEILVADAFSQDNTREIAGRHHAVILDDSGRDMEQGKRLALQRARGDYVVFVDADNEFTHADFVARAVRGLELNPQALGVESYYLPSPKMSSFCAYVTHLLHISDPLSWIMTSNPVRLDVQDEVERWTLPKGGFAYPLGANGFVFRRSDLESVQALEQFQDTHVALHLMRSGKREWLRIRGRGVHHYYVQTWWGFVKKRRRAIAHYMNVRQESKVSWLKHKPPVPLWLGALYCATFLGPAYHTVAGLWRQRDGRWLWHLAACPASLLGTAWGVWTQKTSRRKDRLVADLQVDQRLKAESRGPKP
jgi:glycosyltransferase involved in cell wall biosynthesis